MSDRQQLLTYIQDQIARAELRARAYTIDPAGKQYPTRNAYVRLNKYVMDFVHKKTTSERWLAISGLRGTGKTTLLAQLYCELRIPKERKLFISADHIVQLLSSSINEVLDVYEDVLGTALLSAREPIFLFVDEVQYDPKWAIALKSVYDRAKNVFILTTGSSALEINSNPDTARRVICETLLPMTFPEYEKIRNGIFEQRGLGGRSR